VLIYVAQAIIPFFVDGDEKFERCNSDGVNAIHRVPTTHLRCFVRHPFLRKTFYMLAYEVVYRGKAACLKVFDITWMYDIQKK
jgi:hypothetical protein